MFGQARVESAIEAATGRRPKRLAEMSGGCVGDVYRVEMDDGETLVAKAGDPGSGLGIEGYMLQYLEAHSGLPVPHVLHADDELLVMSYIEASGGLTADSQRHAAELVAALHDVTADTYGLERDTLIGGLHQPNPRSERWIPFFRDHRLLFMGSDALRAGRLPKRVMARLEAFCGRLDKWLEEPERPSLIHGDMWTGNVLTHGRRIAGFIDPAIYYADPEIELAFTTLFGTFGQPFFERYNELRPMRPGFFEERRDLYNLYPLLVHVRLFGGSYVGSVERILSRFGF